MLLLILFLSVLTIISLFFKETLLALAKAVANATASLVLQAKTVATTASDPQVHFLLLNTFM